MDSFAVCGTSRPLAKFPPAAVPNIAWDMALGDPLEEGRYGTLPGGSRVEGFDVNHREARQHRRAAVLAICAVAAVACVATAAVSRASRAELVAVTSAKALKASAQLEERPVSAADTYLQRHGVPSWLSTGTPVKLKPLSTMIHEQLAVKQVAMKAADKKIQKQVAKEKAEPTPHELAMKNALHSQAAKKMSATRMKVAQGTSALASASASEYKVGAIKAKEQQLHRIQKAEHEEELVIETAEEKKLEAIRKEEEHVNHEEVRKLAQVKKDDEAHERKIELEIQALKKSKQASAVNEKRKIKAEMAAIEDEEHEKLAALQKKMSDVKKGKIVDSDRTPAAKPVEKSKVRDHATVQKAAVKVVHADSAGTDQKTALASPKKNKALCTTTKCDLAEEDKQWSRIGSNVGAIAKEAERAHGKARQAALAHMKYLQEQIAKDYKHVTAFAVAQEHALPPAPKMN